MDLKHLRLIQTVAQCEGLTAAGAQLHLSQPALSQQLANIEAELGLRLFHRLGKKMVLTAEGRLALDHGRELLAGMRDLEERLRGHARGLSSELRLGIQCYTALHWLPEVMARFYRAHPHVELKIVGDATHEPVRALLDGRIDMGILNMEEENPRLRITPLFKDELVVVSARGHRFGAKTHVTVEDLISEHVIVYSSPQANAGVLGAALKPVRGRLSRMTELQWTDPIIALVAAGMGVGIVPDWVLAAPASRRKLQRTRITSRGLRRTWSIATLDSPAVPSCASDFAQALIEATRKAQGQG